MKKTIIAVLVMLTLVGCGNAITSGEVVRKTYTPAHTQIVMIPLIRTNGKVTHTTMIPMVYHYNDRWDITIQRVSADGSIMTASFRVTEEVYDATDIGAEFEYNKDYAPNEPEYTRERQT